MFIQEIAQGHDPALCATTAFSVSASCARICANRC
jgi:hypothetical protein